MSSKQDQGGRSLKAMPELALPFQRRSEVAFRHRGREAFPAPEGRRLPHILDIPFGGRLALVVSVIQESGGLRRTARIYLVPSRNGFPCLIGTEISGDALLVSGS